MWVGQAGCWHLAAGRRTERRGTRQDFCLEHILPEHILLMIYSSQNTFSDLCSEYFLYILFRMHYVWKIFCFRGNGGTLDRQPGDRIPPPAFKLTHWPGGPARRPSSDGIVCA
jgi:hypothetical protein